MVLYMQHRYYSRKIMRDLDTSLEQLHEKLDKVAELLKKKPSEGNTELYSALAKAQSEMEMIDYSGENEYWKSKYATITDLVRATRPALTKYGLSVFQQISQNDDGHNILKTVLCHSSGQSIYSTMRLLPPKNNPESIGSYLAHIRRLSYGALVGVAVTDADDDDGEFAMLQERRMEERGTDKKYDAKEPKKKSFETITREQLERLEYELSDFPDIGQMVMEQMRIQTLADMPKNKYDSSLDRIRKIILLRKGRIKEE